MRLKRAAFRLLLLAGVGALCSAGCGEPVISSGRLCDEGYRWTGSQCVPEGRAGSLEVTLVAEPPAGGSPTGGGTFESGDTATLSPGTNEGFIFIGWYEAGEARSAEEGYSFTVTRDVDLAARFEPVREVTRISGANRYSTAAATSEAGWPDGAHAVILARGDESADENPGGPMDAAAAAPLAGLLDAPILLTRSAALHDAARDEIIRLGASRAIILGGAGAISEEVEEALEDLGLSVERLSGENRFHTAALIAGKFQEERGGETLDTAFLLNVHAYSDALAAAPYAAASGMALLYARDDSLPDHTAAAITSLGVRDVIVVGGEAAIGQSVLDAVQVSGSKERIEGQNRYETAVELAGRFISDSALEVVIAMGDDFPDAVAAMPLATRRDTGLLFVSSNRDEPPESVESYLSDRAFFRFTIIGGGASVGEAIEAWLNELIGP